MYAWLFAPEERKSGPRLAELPETDQSTKRPIGIKNDHIENIGHSIFTEAIRRAALVWRQATPMIDACALSCR